VASWERPKSTGDVQRGEAGSINNFINEAAFASFDLEGSARVLVTCPGPVTSVKVLPESAGIRPVIEGSVITFTVSRPGPLVLDINEDWMGSLQLFVNPPEKDAPRPDDPNVIYFGPGIHKIDDMIVGSGKTVYIAGGAVVYSLNTPGKNQRAVFSLVGDSIVLRGRGIIDCSLCPRPMKNTIAINGTNIAIEGVILRDACHWTVPIRSSERVTVKNLKLISHRTSTDGIDICNSRQVEVSKCYLRTVDDPLVIKSNQSGGGVVRDILVKQCVVWNQVCNALSIGAELRETVSNVRFTDCDIIHEKGFAWLRIFHCDSATVRDVVFEDIRCPEAKQFVSLWIGKARWTKDTQRGRIENVIFRNIHVGAEADPRLEILGFDSGHDIKNVSFENVTINGRPLKASDIKQNIYVRDIRVKP
jgi:polygalacturonase